MVEDDNMEGRRFRWVMVDSKGWYGEIRKCRCFEIKEDYFSNSNGNENSGIRYLRRHIIVAVDE